MVQLARRSAHDSPLAKETRARVLDLRKHRNNDADDLIQELILLDPGDLKLDTPANCRRPYGVIPDGG